MVRVVAPLVLLLTALLAGCAGDPAPAQEPAPEAFKDVQVTDTTGAIRGVVFDETITPLAGVVVALTAGANRTTDADGAFVFNGLEPGDYFLQASKPGYVAVQQSVSVTAGNKEPPITKIRLSIDANALKPYYQEYIFDGFIQCSGTFVAVSFAACSAVNIVYPVLDDRFGVTYPMDTTPSWIQTEMIWDSTQAAGGEMTVQYSWGCDTNGGFLCDYGVGGQSPLLLIANATAIAEINGGDYNGTELFIRSFNQGLRETDLGPGGGLGLTLNQKFTYYTHIFFGYEPTPGWRFGDGTPVPQPPA